MNLMYTQKNKHGPPLINGARGDPPLVCKARGDPSPVVEKRPPPTPPDEGRKKGKPPEAYGVSGKLKTLREAGPPPWGELVGALQPAHCGRTGEVCPVMINEKLKVTDYYRLKITD